MVLKWYTFTCMHVFFLSAVSESTKEGVGSLDPGPDPGVGGWGSV